ncbi:MAG: GspE/PulE family protein [Gammaproteobacteria bacterium]|nr:GspE/PulE family protein [Gammaproteobacteria bacterium]
MSPDSKSPEGTRILVLRGRRGVQEYLESFPRKPAASENCAPMLAAAWGRESDLADDRAWAMAERWDLPALASLDFDPTPEALAQFTPEAVRRLRAVPLVVHKGLIAVALEDAGDLETMDQLNFLSSLRVVPIAAPAMLVRNGITRHYDRAEDIAIARSLGLDPSAEAADATEREVERLSKEMPVVRIVTEMISDAVRRRASDIHLRPGEHGADILYRIDDEMVPVRHLIHALQPAVVSRIKVLASMNLAEHRKPQDGRTTFTLDDGHKVDLRISVLPAVHGESVVVRLLDTSEGLWNLEQLGLTPEDRQRLDDVMSRSHGMFLTTGPTGCGKSTTLYAMLLELRKERINILTIEDPVEFYIEDIQQMQVNRAADFTFAGAMRNFLRHDPDVIMVGEIRDRETAGIAVESALTGHLVLSTLHTNTAAATVTRLLDLGVESYLLRASLLAVMSQRLVRLTCQHCRQPETVDAHTRELLGVAPDEEFFIGAGCPQCEGLGVHKRQAVYELLVISPALRKLIVADAEADSIHELAIKEGMTPITQAAVRLAREGRISLAEAWRVRAD